MSFHIPMENTLLINIEFMLYYKLIKNDTFYINIFRSLCLSIGQWLYFF